MQRSRELPNLVMSAKRSVWRMNDHAGEADKVFQAIRKSVLQAADYRCEFCNLRSQKFQEVHHINDDHKNNEAFNLSCACPLCHQVFHIGLAGMQEGADIIYLPELNQAELNQISLALWLASAATPLSGDEVSSSLVVASLSVIAKSLQGLLDSRRQVVFIRIQEALKSTSFPPEKITSLKMHHLTPTIFANLLMNLPEELYNDRTELLGGLRLLPKPARFRRQMEHWEKEQGSIMPVASWPRLAPEGAVDDIIKYCSDQIARLVDAA